MTITGQVTDAQARPVEGIVVMIEPGQRAVTDKGGRFATPYTQEMVYWRKSQYALLAWVRDESRGLAGIVPINDPSKPVRLTLRPAWTVRGRIVDPNGCGIRTARVSSLFGGDVPSDRDGRFELRVIPPSSEGIDYYLRVTAAGFGPLGRQRVFPAGQPGTSVEIETIQMLPANESISGIVVDARGRPAPHIPVIAYALITNEPPDAGARGTATTNEKGGFSVGGLTKGAASVQANFPGSPGGMGSLITTVPAKDLRVILGRDLWGEASLLGKPLPDPTQLCSYLARFKADGKPILVCFGDIRGERYRQLLPKLATKMKALAAKDVAVIVFQYAKVNPTQYQAFINANALPFPIHVVEGDFEAKKIAWCVKSGNWMILADKQHIVRAERLEIDRLEEAIAQLK